MSVRIYKGNRSPSIADTVTVNGSAFDLTGSTVKFQMRTELGTALVIDETATVVLPSAGTVRYDPSATFAALAAGDYVGWWRVTLPSSYTQDTAEFTVEILEHAPQLTSDLCSLADVREYLEIPQNDVSRDRQIETAIVAASAQIIREYEREFAPAATATRTFRHDGGRMLDLTPYDLRTVTTLRLHPESASPETLTAGTQYTLHPLPASGTYTKVRFGSSLTFQSDLFTEFGYCQVEINGAWGFASVPTEVNRAATITVASWLRRDLAALAASLDVTDPRTLEPLLNSNQSIPVAARRLLAPFKRHAGVF